MAKKRAWVTRQIEQYMKFRNDYHTRLIIGADKTPSGTRYDFQPGEVRDDVSIQDRDYLLSLVQNQSSCCGGSDPQPIQLFSEVYK